MSRSFLSYAFSYGQVFLFIFGCVFLEQHFRILGLSTWMVFYLLLRGVALTPLFIVSLFMDAAFVRPLGSTSFVTSSTYLLLQLLRWRKVGKTLQWFAGMILVSLVTTFREGVLSLPFSFWAVCAVFFFLIVFGFTVRRVWQKEV